MNVLIITLASLFLFVASLAFVMLIFYFLPADFFVRQPHQRRESYLWMMLRNIVGFVFISVGFILLFLPGQGLLTILIGLMIADFPGKRRAMLYLVHRPKMRHALNRSRLRLGRPPFRFP